MMDAMKPVRVDSWLWAIRIYKTRSAATTACRAGHVRIGGERTKAAQTVKPGDEVRVRMSGIDRILIVKQTLSKRVGAPVGRCEGASSPRRDRGRFTTCERGTPTSVWRGRVVASNAVMSVTYVLPTRTARADSVSRARDPR